MNRSDSARSQPRSTRTTAGPTYSYFCARPRYVAGGSSMLRFRGASAATGHITITVMTAS
jgi:hypothetical protein